MEDSQSICTVESLKYACWTIAAGNSDCGFMSNDQSGSARGHVLSDG